MLKGGCFCGAVRYEAEGAPFDETLCHCEICRRTTGAPAVAWFSIPAATFRWAQGNPAHFRSSAEATRTFCKTCGTQLTFQHDERRDEMDVTTCSLDDPERAPPKDHIYMRSKLSWIVPGDGLPQHLTTRRASAE